MRDICKCDRCGAIVGFNDTYIVSIRRPKSLTIYANNLNMETGQTWDLCDKCLAPVMDIIQNPLCEAIEVIDPFDLSDLRKREES